MLTFFITLLVAVALIWALAYHSASALVWSVVVGVGLVVGSVTGAIGGVVAGMVWLAFIAFAVIANSKALRVALLSSPIFSTYKKLLPQMSSTEQEALEAGTVWWDGDLFSGKPDWNKWLAVPRATLSAEEQAFIDGPTNELCSMLNEWNVTHEAHDLPPNVWQFIKDNGFLGMIIPKGYGGKGFSAYGHSQVVMKISTRSSTAAVSVMVPNSLGPGELLMHYGTKAQKDYYLPRLAQGLEIPCFALTAPEAGSDAASMPDVGIVCQEMWNGVETLGLRVTWEKRYITLGPIATILGLAFKAYDPDKLLGGQTDLGITCALIPTNHPGVNIGRRHMTLNAAFMNGPNSGQDVFIPMDWIIGGEAMLGQGWRMLMECLAAGRSISLPAQSIAAGKVTAFTSGAYSRVRQQFKTAIGKFEGIEEPLARIGAMTYLMDATRTITAGALDLGEKPSVLSAISKYHATERMRQVINDAMDIHAGKGICLGPNNYLGRAYQQVPIAITVEGANILTRSLIIFGQGAIRCHPWVLKEMKAAREDSLDAFDEAFWEHIKFTIGNAGRSLWLGITAGVGLPAPACPETKRYYQQMTRFSSAFALLADVSMFIIGGSLKRKEKLSARLGDVLSHLYLASCVLKFYDERGQQKDELPLLKWALYDCAFKIQVAMDGIIKNFPNRPVAWALRRLVFPKGMTLIQPSDQLGHEVAKILITPSAARDRLIAGMYLPNDENDIMGQLNAAMNAVVAAEPIEAKVRAAQKAGRITAKVQDAAFEEANSLSVITDTELALWKRARALSKEVVRVDDFDMHFGVTVAQSSGKPTASLTKYAEAAE
ncbi:acyl-CoA dehydrogenase [Betaproteobacteria bacterium UKL13-2]|nr:acyl-CoA dehydrogenase [Betaproteobacteria bacterium UKL13-2]HCG52178.1 acyl-CoA dehydrogenase [Betaproteobacteria bacterium]